MSLIVVEGQQKKGEKIYAYKYYVRRIRFVWFDSRQLSWEYRLFFLRSKLNCCSNVIIVRFDAFTSIFQARIKYDVNWNSELRKCLTSLLKSNLFFNEFILKSIKPNMIHVVTDFSIHVISLKHTSFCHKSTFIAQRQIMMLTTKYSF